VPILKLNASAIFIVNGFESNKNPRLTRSNNVLSTAFDQQKEMHSGYFQGDEECQKGGERYVS
tara:strand:+ start:13629 stop:13817 length:189 start_codon:yes stop_codon:yes gene_type:complete